MGFPPDEKLHGRKRVEGTGTPGGDAARHSDGVAESALGAGRGHSMRAVRWGEHDI